MSLGDWPPGGWGLDSLWNRAPCRRATGHWVARELDSVGAGLRTAGRLATGWLESWTLYGAGLLVAGRLATGWLRVGLSLELGSMQRAECILLGLGQRHESRDCTSTCEPL